MLLRCCCLTALVCLPALPLLGPARADDDDERRPRPRPPAAPVLEWRSRRAFKTDTPPGSVSLSPDGKLLATCEFGEKGGALASVWDTRTGKEVARFSQDGWCHALFSPDGHTVALPFCGWYAIRLYDLDKRKVVRELIDPSHNPGRTHVLDACALSPDGKLIAAGIAEEGVRLWEVATGKDLKRFPDFPTRLPPRETLRVDNLAFSPDGKTLAVKTDKDGILRLLDVATGKEVRRFRHGSHLLAFSPDGSLLALEGEEEDVSEEDPRTGRRVRHEILAISLWDTHNGKLVRRLSWDFDRAWQHLAEERGDEFTPGPGHVSLSFSPDGRCLIAACRDLYVRVWEVASGRQRYQVEDFVWGMSAARASPLMAGLSRESEAVLCDARPRLPAGKAAALPEAGKAWSGLADHDAATAFTLMRSLMAAARQAVALLDKNLPTVPTTEDATIERLVADLDNDQFEVRERASRRLAELGEVARAAMGKAKEPSAEARWRIKELLDALDGPPKGERLRLLRSVEVLEEVGTTEAREVLKRLAGGEPKALLTREAKAALQRLDQK
jgi:hypothetical protein